MPPLPPAPLFRIRFAAIILTLASFAASAQQPAQSDSAMSTMAGMSGHMYLTTLRPPQPGDQQKADAIVAAARAAMEPYQD